MKSVICTATVAALAAVGLSGCGTITQGTTQNITIATSPPGAHCELRRDGGQIATLYSTPDKVNVHKDREDIVLTCAKRGYETTSVILESGYGIGAFGNIILGGAAGWMIDYTDGAVNKYPTSAAVQLVPLKSDPALVAQSRSLCTPDDEELARLAQQNHYSARLICD